MNIKLTHFVQKQAVVNVYEVIFMLMMLFFHKALHSTFLFRGGHRQQRSDGLAFFAENRGI